MVRETKTLQRGGGALLAAALFLTAPFSARASDLDNLKGALAIAIGAAIAAGVKQDQPAATPQEQAGQQAAPTTQAKKLSGPSAEQQAQYEQIAKDLYEHAEFASRSASKICGDAKEKFADPFYLNTNQCEQALRPLTDADAAKRASAEAERQKTARAAAEAASAKIVQRSGSGDRSAVLDCDKINADSATKDGCQKASIEALKSSLRSKQVKPTNCREWEIAKGLDGTPPLDIMRVTLGSKGKSGSFVGETRNVDDDSLTIFNATTSDNASIGIKGAEIFNGEAIGQGVRVIGYGVQTETVSAKRINGEPTTIARISARCISPVTLDMTLNAMLGLGL
ncbi:hypothetical protein WKW77_12185 [Variovorax ureilyticus]|uniref:Uncharacterized protein n=1 Tax=Variovorax ureilyticus TaxID=1836198 RepID=A0ABU8VDT8_9BURK